MDKHKQRIDNLFLNNLNLPALRTIDVTAFYQTIDDKTIQNLCESHMSANALQSNLINLNISHCYLVTDAGIQWIVGSCHSPKLKTLNLSNVDLTGNCFLRKMHALTSLKLESCTSLNGQGLQNIATSCANLLELSLGLNKQLQGKTL